ncbi:MAG: hypothetical protein KAY24_19370 [Candidatus Eisenbacteria sp.]|nr:hypothetical protein [Candidatus Eisenbacteria bacterium]
MDPRRSPVFSGRLLLGGALILVGLLLILGQLGIIEPAGFWHYWPVLLIGYGLIQMLGSSFSSQRVCGIVVLVFGIVFLLHELTSINIPWGLLWPIALVALGLRIVWRGTVGRRGASSSTDVRVREWAVFGGGERRVTAHNFRGGEITACFGGIDLDLRDAQIEGQEAVIEVLVMFGGIDIIVPHDWEVALEPVTIFGGCDDNRRPPEKPPDSARKRLVIRGTIIFGGLDVK